MCIKQEVLELIEGLEKFLNDVEDDRYSEEYLSLGVEEGWNQWHDDVDSYYPPSPLSFDDISF